MPNELLNKIEATKHEVVSNLDQYIIPMNSSTANSSTLGALTTGYTYWPQHPTPTYVYNPNVKIYKAENGFVVEKDGKTFVEANKQDLVKYF